MLIHQKLYTVQALKLFASEVHSIFLYKSNPITSGMERVGYCTTLHESRPSAVRKKRTPSAAEAFEYLGLNNYMRRLK